MTKIIDCDDSLANGFQVNLGAKGTTTTFKIRVTGRRNPNDLTDDSGELSTTYTVNVARAAAASTDATLQNLVLSHPISPNFDPDTTAYTASVPNGFNGCGCSYVQFAPPNDSAATVAYRYRTNLPNNSTTDVSVTVTAEDGTTTKTYTVAVTTRMGGI